MSTVKSKTTSKTEPLADERGEVGSWLILLAGLAAAALIAAGVLGAVIGTLADDVAAAAAGEGVARTGTGSDTDPSGDGTGDGGDTGDDGGDGTGPTGGEDGDGDPSDPQDPDTETPQAIAERQALLASDVYDSEGGELPDGWERIDPDNIPQELRDQGITRELLTDEDIGYDAAIYQSEDGDYVVAFRGTDGFDDHIRTNVPQNLGLETEQYNRAVELVRRMNEASPDGGLSVTGHSLGGGLASVAALANEVPATTYDPAGIHPDTLERYGADPARAEEFITAYHVDGEVLSNDVVPVQVAGVWTRQNMQEPIGTMITLPAIDPNGQVLGPINDPGERPAWFGEEARIWNEQMAEFEREGVRRHGIDWVERGLDAIGGE